MLVLVCYDVNTETSAGRRRLRRVICRQLLQRRNPAIEVGDLLIGLGDERVPFGRRRRE